MPYGRSSEEGRKGHAEPSTFSGGLSIFLAGWAKAGGATGEEHQLRAGVGCCYLRVACTVEAAEVRVATRTQCSVRACQQEEKKKEKAHEKTKEECGTEETGRGGKGEDQLLGDEEEDNQKNRYRKEDFGNSSNYKARNPSDRKDKKKEQHTATHTHANGSLTLHS